MNYARSLRHEVSGFDAPRQGRRDNKADGLRIALFSGNYNCVRDGANNALNRLVAHLEKEGAQVRIYSPTCAAPAFQPVGELVDIPSISILGRPEYRLGLGLPRKVREDIRRFQPTHFHLSAPDLSGKSAQLFAKKLKIPVVTSLHTRFETYLDYYRLGLLRFLARRHLKAFYASSDHVLAPNKAMAVWLRELGVQSTLSIWGRGVDQDLFSTTRRDMSWRRKLGYKDNEVAVLFFGRLVMEKGLRIFDQVMRQLSDRGHSLRPMIIGDGPARSFMKSRMPAGIFTGHLEGADLARAVASADILINPSTTEAFGNVNLEAMAAGLAIVSADVPSAKSLLRTPDLGLLVAPDDPAAYAEAVEDLILSPGRRRALGNAATSAASGYSWDETLNSVIKSYWTSSKEASHDLRSTPVNCWKSDAETVVHGHASAP
jgi:glycosyltransferase involved in cell wall biosynthesis